MPAPCSKHPPLPCKGSNVPNGEAHYSQRQNHPRLSLDKRDSPRATAMSASVSRKGAASHSLLEVDAEVGCHHPPSNKDSAASDGAVNHGSRGASMSEPGNGVGNLNGGQTTSPRGRTVGHSAQPRSREERSLPWMPFQVGARLVHSHHPLLRGVEEHHILKAQPFLIQVAEEEASVLLHLLTFQLHRIWVGKRKWVLRG